MTFSHIQTLLQRLFGKLGFSDMQKPLKDTAISFRITADLKKWIDTEAERLGMSTSQLIELLLQQYQLSREKHGDRIKWPPDFIRYGHTPEESE